MNELGVSSSNYYPLETELAFDKMCETGCRVTEVFLCSKSETKEKYLTEMRKKADDNGIKIVSLHPYTSVLENTFLFSQYKRRFYDTLEEYKRFFEAANILGAKIFVIHGAKSFCNIPDEEHCSRFSEFIDLGLKYEVQVCQENVVNYLAQSTEYLKMMSDNIGDRFGIVLDIKQARRAGMDEIELINTLGQHIRHVHLSDCSEENDCIPPCTGSYDFKKLFTALKENGYKGDYIIELYRHSYGDYDEVKQSFLKLNSLLQSVI